MTVESATLPPLCLWHSDPVVTAPPTCLFFKCFKWYIQHDLADKTDQTDDPQDQTPRPNTQPKSRSDDLQTEGSRSRSGVVFSSSFHCQSYYLEVHQESYFAFINSARSFCSSWRVGIYHLAQNNLSSDFKTIHIHPDILLFLTCLIFILEEGFF